MQYIGSETDDWDIKGFIGFTNSFTAVKANEQGILIIRRERNITKGTGTLLSPNGRSLGQLFPDKVVLTMYKVAGNKG